MNRFEKTLDTIEKINNAKIKISTKNFIGISENVVKSLIDDAETVLHSSRSDVAINIEEMIVFKLQRGNPKDLGDIFTLLKYNSEPDMSDFYLTSEQKKKLNELAEQARVSQENERIDNVSRS